MLIVSESFINLVSYIANNVSLISCTYYELFMYNKQDQK